MTRTGREPRRRVTSFEIDYDGKLGARLAALTLAERQQCIARMIEELPTMQPGWYRGLDDLVARIDDAELERTIGAAAKAQAGACIAAARRAR